MRFSTKARYGLRLVVRIAQECAHARSPNEPIPLWKLAEKERISKKYVEHIVSRLERAEILRGFRGPAGGYCLTRPPSRIKAREVIEAVESISPNVCTRKLTDCPLYPYSRSCSVRPLWIGLEKVMRDYLDSVTIESLSQGKMSIGQKGQKRRTKK
ncbi:MAG: RrF2 family transcriptional regulator [candidate division WOR-3 bacterium]